MKSPAKINLCLRVHEKQADGYHRIETVMAKIDLSDDIEIEIGDGEGIEITVPGFPKLKNAKNLAVRAAAEYLKASGIKKRVTIRLEKKLPIGGGVGGGSSNAGTVLRLLNQELKCFSENQLLEVSASIGADVALFASPFSWVYASGVGEKLTQLQPFSSIPLILVDPGFPVSTPKAYQALSRSLTWKHPNGTSFAPKSGPEKLNDLDRLLEIGNDLQPVVEGMNPPIRAVREELKKQGAYFAQMSGSGSTVFGLFKDRSEAESAAKRLEKRWKVFITRTLE